MKSASVLSLTFAISACLLVATSSASASHLEPVPLYGAYDMHLDRAKQTFNGHPNPTDLPVKQTENFITQCDASGCLARSLNKRPPPEFFEYHWVADHWESVVGQQHQYIICKDGSKVASVKIDIIKPSGEGGFTGERNITVKGAGCPNEGPGKYWLPFSLTPVG